MDLLLLSVNEVRLKVHQPLSSATLLQFLRSPHEACSRLEIVPRFGNCATHSERALSPPLIGAKPSCGQGVCGCCTVTVARSHAAQSSVNACLMLLCHCHGLSVTTVEGLSATQPSLHPVQEALKAQHALQCGYCTPGVVMALFASQARNVSMDTCMDGNICRCTGYRPIIDAAREIMLKKGCQLSVGCIEPSQAALEPGGYPPLHFQDGEETMWKSPASLDELLTLMRAYPRAKLAIGNTSLGYCGDDSAEIINPLNIAELQKITFSAESLRIGACCTLSCFYDAIENWTSSSILKDVKPVTVSEVKHMLKSIANPTVRNMASIGGNLAMMKQWNRTDSCVWTLFQALSATVKCCDANTPQVDIVTLDMIAFEEMDWTSGRFLIVGFEVPASSFAQTVLLDRVSQKGPNSRPLVSSFVRCEEDNTHNFALSSRIACKACVLVPNAAISKCRGLLTAKDLQCNKVIATLRKALEKDFESISVAVHIKQLMIGSFCKLFLLAIRHLNHSISTTPTLFQRVPLSRFQASQSFTESVHEVSLGKLHAKERADFLLRGDTRFTGDIQAPEGVLYGALVGSSYAHARILSIDASAALSGAGVVDFVSATDIPGMNSCGLATALSCSDEELFASEMVLWIGQPVGLILAETSSIALAAARKVHVAYEPLPAITSIEEGIKCNSYLPKEAAGVRLLDKLEVGNVDSVKASDTILEICGTSRCGSQYHFYTETQSALAIPTERGEMTVFSATQDTSGVQTKVCEALNLKAHNVVVKTSRTGGDFGGKGPRSLPVAVAAAVGAYKICQAVKLVLPRHTDIEGMGKRHELLFNYRVKVDRSASTIVALELDLFFNCGAAVDTSLLVANVAVLGIENAYWIPNLSVKTSCVLTHLPPSTAVRGFGVPQAVYAIEYILDHVAHELGQSPAIVRERNFLRQNHKTPYGQRLDKWNGPLLWEEMKQWCNYEARVKEVREFNDTQSLVKRGIALVPLKYGVSYIPPFLNQAACLLQVFAADGSLCVYHGGIEMGQGIHTKIVQVCVEILHDLGLTAADVRIGESSTHATPNRLPTGGSVASDLNCMAVEKACRLLKERLQPLKSQATDTCSSWTGLIRFAWVAQVSLTVEAIAGFDGISWNESTHSGCPFKYFVPGAACVVSEIDCLTGDSQILSAHLMCDAGCSVNPAIDIGQMEGGFVQGMGLFCSEEVEISEDGRMMNSACLDYGVPAVSCMPIEFHVRLFDDPMHHSDKGGSVRLSEPGYGYRRAKSLGEPPLCLAVACFLSIRHGLQAHSSSESFVSLTAPCTRAKIASSLH